jgi:hypothetical protein
VDTHHPHLLGQLHQPVAEQEHDEHQTVGVVQRDDRHQDGRFVGRVPAPEEDAQEDRARDEAEGCVVCVCGVCIMGMSGRSVDRMRTCLYTYESADGRTHELPDLHERVPGALGDLWI